MTIAALSAVACSRPGTRSELTVFAASSLTHALGDFAKMFERTHPTARVSLNFAGSQTLRLQIEHGATADVFASANRSHVLALFEQGLVAPPRAYVQNALALVVPETNPAHITTLWDLPRAERIVVGTAEVPVGAYTRTLLARARAVRGDEWLRAVEARIVSREPNVRLVLAKVELGEADAAFVYQSDVRVSTKVRTVPIPPRLRQHAAYFITRVRRGGATALADAFIEQARSRDGLEVMRRYGFEGRPP